MNNLPFIKLFKSVYGHYFFDVNTNQIVKISQDAYLKLEKILKEGSHTGGSDLIDELIQGDLELSELRSEGFLKSNRPLKIEMKETAKLPYFLEHRLRTLTLQVTQQCNFRCRYCHYTYGDDKQYHSHKSNSMSWETAKAAIDFFAERTRDTVRLDVGFYGGEPLLEYELIKKCVEYCKTKFEGKKLSFHMTTNAFLLTVDRARYLIENGTSILVSIDGPREIHDKNRKNAGNGSGTFDVVFKNLEKIKNEIPQYYEKLSFNSVLDPVNDCSKVNNFFNCDMFRKQEVKASVLQPSVGKGVFYSQEYLNTDKKDRLLALLAKIGVIEESCLSVLALNNLTAIKRFDDDMQRFDDISQVMGHGGPCQPGVFKLFVTTNGNLFPCEKIKDNSEVMKLGTVFTSIDAEKAKYLFNVGNICTERCVNCWNIRHCQLCATKINDGNALSAEMCATECKKNCSNTASRIKAYIALREVKEMIDKGAVS
ncbi:MAG: radical SAM protein [Clostridia bacterium]|nr:radical SAM protein [Clostridia bacterium]